MAFLLTLMCSLAALAANPTTFRARLVEDFGSLDWNHGEVSGEIVYQLMEGLFRGGKDGQPQRAAARSYRWNRDKTEMTIRLRADRPWSDGAPLCAQHFVDSWERLRTKEFGSPFAHYAGVLDTFRARGCRALTIRFRRPAPEAPALLANLVFFPVRLDQLRTRAKIFNEGVGLLVNGPFRVAEWRKNARLTLERNPRYGGAQPYLERVEYRFIPEDNTAKNLFELGELDWVKDVPQLLRTPALEMSPEFRTFPSLIVYYFGLNATRAPLLADPEVRAALSASLDRDEIPRILGKECRSTRSWLVPEIAPGIKSPILVAGDGVRQKLRSAVARGEMNLLLRVYSKTAHKVLAEWAQGQWEKNLGVRIPLEVQESKVYWKEINVSPSPLFFGGVTAPYGHPRAFLQDFLSTSSANWTGWKSAEFDAAVAGERWAQAERILEKDGHVIPLYQRDTVALVQKKWRGFHVNPLGQVFLRDVK